RQPGQAAAQAAAFRIVPAQRTVDLSAGSVSFDVEVSDASGMAAFQFELRYDPGVLAQPSVALGPFLSGPGLSPQCPAPIVDGIDGPGTVLYGCAGSASLDNPGVSGSGTVATVTFRLAGGSSSAIL